MRYMDVEYQHHIYQMGEVHYKKKLSITVLELFISFVGLLINGTK